LAQAGFHRNADVKIVPLPGERLRREVYLLTRAGEFSDLANNLTAFACEALDALIADEFSPMMPWLSEQMAVGEK
jgi:hypothetical protein